MSKGLLLLLWLFFVHLAGIYLFTRGFLLTRLALSEATACPDGSCTLQPSHERAIILIIDALRFDFLSSNPPEPPSQHHHHVLSIPQELTAAKPSHSILFDSHADPPTTTLQRIKGLTTGSLPTFIDMGSNFGGTTILEDSLIGQLTRAGKKNIAFMGDDTWTTVFPDSFDPEMCSPYDSFNVEDLHTVDEGVIAHLFPLLRQPTPSWDFLIGHFLGVDHVGHRVGPDHPTMHAKLTQMDNVLREVVELLDDRTLLVVLGDHGMDRKGDHGGDSIHETSAALWLYSKGAPLRDPAAPIPASLIPERRFPGSTALHRVVQQIDLVPTLSLLLGLPIPFNNLGTVIPELFWRGTEGIGFARVLQLNARQIREYLGAYRASASGGELDPVWPELEHLWDGIEGAAREGNEALLDAMQTYTGSALESCRMLWARFNVVRMGLGLVLLAMGIAAGVAMYLKLGQVKEKWEEWATTTQARLIRGLASGALIGFVIQFPLKQYAKSAELDSLDCVTYGAAFVSCLSVIIDFPPKLSSSLTSIPLPLILHTLAFASNSFTVWEDRVITYLLLSSAVPSVLTGFRAPTPRLRARILGFSALFAVCVRAIASSTVCREEQQPYCHVTFFASSSRPSPPLPVLILSLPTALALPCIMKRFLRISKSDQGVATLVLPWLLPVVLLQGAGFWVIEWMDSAEVLGPEWAGLLRWSRTLLARGAMGAALSFGLVLWWLVPLCLKVNTKSTSDSGPPDTVAANGEAGRAQERREVTIIGFANAFGAPYLVFWCIVLGLLYPTTQLTGQLVLALASIAVLAHLEVIDSVRDVRMLEAQFAAKPSALLNLNGEALHSPARSPAVTFAEVAPLALLALHTFYGTGHQSAIPSIQWKAAFVLTPTNTYPLSPLLVILNAWSPLFLLALAVPLVAAWNVGPLPVKEATAHVRGGSVRAALSVMLYHATLLLGSAVCSAWLRRHLMVWKVFAPRFMNAAACLVAVDLGVLLGIGIALPRIEKKIGQLFSGMPRA
ncbi:hypothetical protein CERSUDRAFT_88925 [Gelatoporia subvermispora B]|uniref:GPI ethanolamine phosphate transferase 2 C-terminal domain-containing protein n=1 Tax=Ceriporiopsis subvermispora (strain B) TaxID=914234 RepID=M2QYG6_CERS8|nr:hypothetical protein CERSUDRAFT_88925 [Gelatoporia subvermispora B]